MTTWAETEITCAICGSTSTFQVLHSSNQMGPSDLDTRPAEMLRSTMGMWIQRCPTCGYCAPKVDEIPADRQRIRTFLEDERYQQQWKDTTYPYLANDFLCWSLIAEALESFTEAGWASLHAAWACDDSQKDAQARQARLRAVELFRQAQTHQQPFAGQPGAEEAILTDMLRRCGQFESALAEVQRGLAQNPPDVVQHVLTFQRSLCARHDDQVHTMAEVKS
jgi:uncharacterized protein (DUF2225 family)